MSGFVSVYLSKKIKKIACYGLNFDVLPNSGKWDFFFSLKLYPECFRSSLEHQDCDWRWKGIKGVPSGILFPYFFSILNAEKDGLTSHPPE